MGSRRTRQKTRREQEELLAEENRLEEERRRKQEELLAEEEREKASRLPRNNGEYDEIPTAEEITTRLHETQSKLQEIESENAQLNAELKLAKKANKHFYEKFLKESEELKQAKKAHSDQLRQERAAYSDLQKALTKMNQKFDDEKFSFRQANEVFRTVIQNTNSWLRTMSINRETTSNWWRYEFRGEINDRPDDCGYILRLVRHESHVLSDEQKQKMLPSSLSFSDKRPAEIVVVTSKIRMSLVNVHIANIDVYDISRLGIFRQMAEAIKQNKDNLLNSSAMEGKKFASLITHVSFMLGLKFLQFIRKHHWELESPYQLNQFDQDANISINAAAEGTKHILKPYDDESGRDSRFGYRGYPVFNTESYMLTEHFIQTLIDNWRTATENYEEREDVKDNPSKLSRFNARF